MENRRVGLAILLIAPALLIILAVFVAPLGFTFVTSFYTHAPGKIMTPELTFANYRTFFADSFYWRCIGTTLLIGFSTTLATLVIGYPIAFMLARNPRFRVVQLTLLVSPLFVNMIIRTYGWKVLLASTGLINRALVSIGLIQEPIRFVNNLPGVVVALVHVLLPFMVLSISSVLQGIDQSYLEAGATLGASRSRVFAKIILPLSMPGVVAGSVLVFSGAAGSFIVPSLMGGGRVRTIPTLMYQYMTQLLNWPFGAVLAFTMSLISIGVILAASRLAMSRQGGISVTQA